MGALGLLGVGLSAFLLLVGTANAQSTAAVDPSQLTTPLSGAAPADVAVLIGICGPVIDAQYLNSQARRGECVSPTGKYLDAQKVNTAPTGMGQVVANTVTALVKLYKPGVTCVPHATELPEAIGLAETYTTDQVQVDALKSIAAAIDTCQDIATGAIAQPIPASAG
jgi:hypothetical protein